MKSVQANQTQTASNRRSRAAAGRERRKRAFQTLLPNSPIAELGLVGAQIANDSIAIVGQTLPDGSSLSFTVGMAELLGKPEIVITGFDRMAAGALLQDMIALIAEKDLGTSPIVISDGGPMSFALMGGCDCGGSLPMLKEYYGGRPFTAIQCFWSDEGGNFPWHPGASAEFRARQAKLPTTRASA